MEKVLLNSELEKLRELALKEIMQLSEEECKMLLIMIQTEGRGRAS